MTRPPLELPCGKDASTPLVFDCEKWAHAVYLEPFRISRLCVTTQEYAAFIDAGGA